MNLRKILTDLARVLVDEAERNPEFNEKLLGALGQNKSPLPTDRAESKSTDKPKNRRTAAVLDPIELASSGEQVLRSRLAELTVAQLQDIVSGYAMDPGRLVSKWKTQERIIDRIVELSLVRAQKGDAFRSDT
jgi:hypothetical protein